MKNITNTTKGRSVLNDDLTQLTLCRRGTNKAMRWACTNVEPWKADERTQVLLALAVVRHRELTGKIPHSLARREERMKEVLSILDRPTLRLVAGPDNRRAA